MTKLKYKYVVIDDDLNVCESVKKRMSQFEKWNCSGLIVSLTEAISKITKDLPQLIFLDWSIKGGTAFTLLEKMEQFDNYNPYIIFFTGYQNDHPEIPMELINRFKVNRYLVKPIYENLTNYLHEYVVDAELNFTKKFINKEFWITTCEKQKIKIDPLEIICISQSRSNPRNKIIHLNNGQNIEIKASWEVCEEIVKNNSIKYLFANTRDTLIIADYITKLQKPFIWLNNELKVEVTKDKWKDFEDTIQK